MIYILVRLLFANPNVFIYFRRKDKAEGTNHIIKIRQASKDLMEGMHDLKDLKDLDKTKTGRYSFSRRADDKKMLDDYHFMNMLPLEDFVRPESPVTPRTTGYSSGHIRSMLKLDTFGPTGSVLANAQRDLGLLPASPNVDRHLLLNHRLDGVHGPSSRGGSDNVSTHSGGTKSYASSHASDYLPSLAHEAMRVTTGDTHGKTMKKYFKQTSNVIPDDNPFNSPPSPLSSGFSRKSLRPGTLGYHGPALSHSDRLLGDPFLKSKEYFKAHTHKLQVSTILTGILF
jgi:hypothetical protein